MSQLTKVKESQALHPSFLPSSAWGSHPHVCKSRLSLDGLYCSCDEERRGEGKEAFAFLTRLCLYTWKLLVCNYHILSLAASKSRKRNILSFLPEYFFFSMSNSLWPHGLQHTRLPCPPSPGTCSNSCLSSLWFYPTISSSVVHFFSCLQSFPALGSFPMSWLFA